MPELPEVETTVRGLKKEVVGHTILDVWTDLDTKDRRKNDTVANKIFFKKFKKQVRGEKIIKVERRAKNILLHLSNKKTILVHMKMTGRLLVKNFDRFVHFKFRLSRGKELAFSDPRKFGKITLLDTESIRESKHLLGLGPEPLEKVFDLPALKQRLLKNKSRKIKTVLLDQKVIAGIGNIYSDEILWHAKISPERKSNSLKNSEIDAIFKFTKELLRKGIDFGGDSMSDYVNIYGGKGEFQMHHMAYGRKGEKCKKNKCKGVIIRKMISGRSAHFCDSHQK